MAYSRIKDNIFKIIKYQLNSLLSVSIKTMSILVFSDYLDLSYTIVFWTTFVFVIFTSYNIQKFYVFESSNESSFLKFLVSATIFGLLEYLISFYLANYVNFYYLAFLISGVFVFFLRYLFNKNYVFKNKD